jgi:NAD(P)-dependent dehydrogenase (short-subunit alcohol dehydrogenase family)
MNDAHAADVPFDVAGKVVLLTGAGRGIGRGIARVFAESRAKVAVNALSDRHAGPLVQSINDAGGEAQLVVGDVTHSDVAERIVAETVARFGRVDVLVNALGDAISHSVAAIDGRQGMSDEEWRMIVDLNLTHVFSTSRAAARRMYDQGHGKIINIASFMVARGGARLASYTAAKAGVVGLTRALALEWAPTIQVNAIAPGIFPDDEVLAREDLRVRDLDARGNIPMQRVGRPREVGYLARFLASPAADYLTGQTIHLDGGLTIK